ncbi:MAG: HD domain-containing protein [Terriglobia bacterium]|jgi:3'-5' exoribonuclease
MKERFVTDLSPDAQVRTTFLVQARERKIARTGSAYLDLDLRDASGVVRAKLWDCDRHALDFEVEDIVAVDGVVEDYQGTLQIRVRKISRCSPDDVDLFDYLPHSRRDPEEMYVTLLDRLRRVPEGPLRMLLLTIMEDPSIAEKYKRAPAAMSYHHAFLGGLLEHVLSLVQLGDQVCDHYEFLRRDLLLAGLVLHDVGKIEELSFSRGFRYSTRGQLLGHISIGLEMVQEKMRQIPGFPAELKGQIEHIILSHHGKVEFGSPKEPVFPEALVVHFLDEMDSKLEAMRAQYATDQDRPGDWTARNPALRRELLKIERGSPASSNGPDAEKP